MSTDGPDAVRSDAHWATCLEIEAVVKQYATAVDERDWQSLEDCFVEEAVGDYVGMAQLEGRAAIVEWISSKVASADVTTHLMTNIEVTLLDGLARSRCYGTAYLKFLSPPGPVLVTRSLVYRDELVVDGGKWRILKRRHEARHMTYAPEMSPEQLTW